VALDPYGFPEPEAAPRLRGWSRWSVPLAWLATDVLVGGCSGIFTALAWDTPDDPQYIGLFSSPWWGCSGTGTFVAFCLALLRVRPLFQALGSGFLAFLAWIALPTLWFMGLVASEMVKVG
jgi:hypothetical protein